ncbi:MAG TPA: FAD-dependent oxidoreductase [Thermoguttaceae bacterium]|nr:FAD-dependent oxidoreductase [Thermoguttaceae bacterium]
MDCYRLVVIGGGPAGIAGAREAARRGVRVAMVLPPLGDPPPPEPPREPTSLVEQIRRARTRFGLTGPGKPPDTSGIDVLHGAAVFSGPRTITLGDREIHFRHALIATGTTAAPADIDGADRSDCLRPETLTDLTEVPRRLAVIGSGPSACQWAQFFCRSGSEVYLIGRHGTILPGEDREAVAVIRDQLERDGVRLKLSRDELRIETTGNLYGLVMERGGAKQELLVDRVLLCGRRQPNVAGLGLETAGVVCTREGLVVGRWLQTTNRRVFSAGEVCGSQWAGLSAAEASGRWAARNAMGRLKREFRREIIPRCIHTDPMLARVGLTNEEAAARGIEIDTYRVELSEGNEAIAESRRRGFISVDVHRHTGRIVAATVVAEDADELIAPLVLLMTRKRSFAALAGVTACHPSRFELLVRLADAYSATRRCFRSRTIARCRAWLRRRTSSD